MSDPIAWDKKGIPIQHGDLLKTYHFTDGRRKQFFYHVAVWRHDQNALEAIPYSYVLPDSPCSGGRFCLIGMQSEMEVIEGDPHYDNGYPKLFWERKKVKSRD